MEKIENSQNILNSLNFKSKSIRDEFEEVGEGSLGKDPLLEKKYNELLKKSRWLESIYKFQSSIIHHMSSSLLVVGIDGSVQFSNKAAQQLLEYQHEELNSLNIVDLFADREIGEQFLQFITRSDKNLHNKEFDFHTKSNKVIHIGLTTTRFHDEYNNYDGVILLFKDLNEVKQLRKQIERMDRLALLGELSAGIAHEIRNPLAGIKAAAQILEESLKDNQQYQVLLERIIKEIDKSNKLLKEFFKFAKPSKPKFEFVDMASVIDGLFLLINPRIRKQNILAHLRIDENLPRAYVDETQIEQVLLNILLNALDAMPQGGDLSISIKSIELNPMDFLYAFELDELAEKAPFIEISISDSGVGINQENLDKIFDPFFTTKASGLGLGLSICSRLLEENHGKIDVKSEEGKGTTFTILLPCFLHK